MAHVAALQLLRRRPRRFGREDLAIAAGHVHRPLDRIEDEELRLRAEVRDIAETGRLEVGLGALRERARVALVALAVGRLDHVAGEEQRRLVHERIDARRRGIGQQQHVGRLDPLPPGDRRAVERVAVLELALVEHGRGDGDVLHHAGQVAEPEVDELIRSVGQHLHDFLGPGHGLLLFCITIRPSVLPERDFTTVATV